MFRTEIENIKSSLEISYNDKLLSLGSCFAQEIGERLLANKFDISVNPYGTIFNPLSTFELLEMSIADAPKLDHSLIKNDGIYYSFKLHSSFRNTSKSRLLKQIHHQLKQTKQHLTKTKVLFFTFGTAWVYELKNDDVLVANCHKQPQNQFNKRLLGVEEIITAFFSLKQTLEAYNPDLKILLTVSPVRHTRETLQLNAASKAVLKLACHYLSGMTNDVFYFPSYEIMMDDLRDYRFYQKDLIHPNEQAIDYIWQKFSETYLSKDTQKTMHQWQRLQRALDHKPFNAQSSKHQNFLKKTLRDLERLNKKLDLREEIKKVKSQLKA